MALHFQRAITITVVSLAATLALACGAPNTNNSNIAPTTTPAANNNTTQPPSHIAESGKRYFLWVALGTKEVTYDCNVREVRGKWVRCDGSRLATPNTNEKKMDYTDLWLDMDYVVAALPHQGT